MIVMIVMKVLIVLIVLLVKIVKIAIIVMNTDVKNSMPVSLPEFGKLILNFPIRKKCCLLGYVAVCTNALCDSRAEGLEEQVFGALCISGQKFLNNHGLITVCTN